ncbi:hypothetical protein ATC82_12385 [Staphylococcus aureus]|nr:hypothetical protein ATC82_12385 [Staphylococcus aureus]
MIWVVYFDTTNFNLANSIVNSFLRSKLMLFFNNLHQINSKNYVIRANISSFVIQLIKNKSKCTTFYNSLSRV